MGLERDMATQYGKHLHKVLRVFSQASGWGTVLNTGYNLLILKCFYLVFIEIIL